jgi:hypothetical protein
MREYRYFQGGLKLNHRGPTERKDLRKDLRKEKWAGAGDSGGCDLADK